MPPVSYDEDFYAWTREQAAALRHLAAMRPNLPVELDLENLAEEVEGLGREQRSEVEGYIEQILEHLILLAWSPGRAERFAWQNIVDRARGEVGRRLTPSLRAEIEARVADFYGHARRCAEHVLRHRHEDEILGALPDICPWTLEDILAESFWPENQWKIRTHGK